MVPQVIVHEESQSVDLSGKERPDVWLFDVNITYKDNTERQFAAVRDFFNHRLINAVVADFKIPAKDAAVRTFLTALGYPPPAGSLPANIRAIVFRFSAVTTNGLIHVAGASDQVPQINSDNLAAALVALNKDAQFVAFFTAITS